MKQSFSNFSTAVILHVEDNTEAMDDIAEADNVGETSTNGSAEDDLSSYTPSDDFSSDTPRNAEKRQVQTEHTTRLSECEFRLDDVNIKVSEVNDSMMKLIQDNPDQLGKNTFNRAMDKQEKMEDSLNYMSSLEAAGFYHGGDRKIIAQIENNEKLSEIISTGRSSLYVRDNMDKLSQENHELDVERSSLLRRMEESDADYAERLNEIDKRYDEIERRNDENQDTENQNTGNQDTENQDTENQNTGNQDTENQDTDNKNTENQQDSKKRPNTETDQYSSDNKKQKTENTEQSTENSGQGSQDNKGKGRESLLDDYANPMDNMPSYMDPED